MYYDFFGFREPPFSIAPDPRYLYLSERHKEALAHLMYGVQGQGGFIVITGEVGTGKTTVSRCFIENVPAHVDIALILNPRLSARELLASVCDEFGVAYPDNATIKLLVDRINLHLIDAHARGRHQVLMIDEAQNLSAEVLEQLRLLTNLETSEKKLLQIVLLGQPELKEMLERPELRQLNQRVTARYHLDALERDELPAYLHYRLGVAGVKVDLFSPAAIRLLFRKSQGVPRLINLISDRALLGAYSESLHQIEAHHVREAAREVGSRPRSQSESGISPALRYLTLASAVLAVAVAAFAYTDSRRDAGAERAEAQPPVEATADPADDQGNVPQVDGPEHAGPEAPTADIGAGSPIVESAAAAGTVERAEIREVESQVPDLEDFDLAEHGMNTAEAYEELFQVWGHAWDRTDYPLACEYADAAGLGCLHKQGSRRSMEEINRPAVLELRGPDGGAAYVTLVGLDGDEATLKTPEGAVKVSFSELQNYWFGNYSVLWQVPPYMAWDGDPGELSRQYQKGVWLSARMMQLVGLHASDDREIERISRLVRDEQVRWYQKVKRLEQDGVIGAMTLIQMSNDLDAGVPRLVPGSHSVVSPIGPAQTLQPRSG
ncbi:general secretion pathway protein A [Marinobacter daqiaonensis]|uniref:General secretion pathway protein A n=1 Tax=Marinobacter daqiaonensis TaxID=650891 RepID=A0A1I6GWW9_9GAMM|nr:AAA family ATPase [Marinobacter daqiaonensis]SFR46678.1 general secretion pathway protein A [Marinobacter daqiaonensis]